MVVLNIIEFYVYNTRYGIIKLYNILWERSFEMFSQYVIRIYYIKKVIKIKIRK